MEEFFNSTLEDPFPSFRSQPHLEVKSEAVLFKLRYQLAENMSIVIALPSDL
jgi:hypothetical protein